MKRKKGPKAACAGTTESGNRNDRPSRTQSNGSGRHQGRQDTRQQRTNGRLPGNSQAPRQEPRRDPGRYRQERQSGPKEQAPQTKASAQSTTLAEEPTQEKLPENQVAEPPRTQDAQPPQTQAEKQPQIEVAEPSAALKAEPKKEDEQKGVLLAVALEMMLFKLCVSCRVGSDI